MVAVRYDHRVDIHIYVNLDYVSLVVDDGLAPIWDQCMIYVILAIPWLVITSSFVTRPSANTLLAFKSRNISVSVKVESIVYNLSNLLVYTVEFLPKTKITYSTYFHIKKRWYTEMFIQKNEGIFHFYMTLNNTITLCHLISLKRSNRNIFQTKFN